MSSTKSKMSLGVAIALFAGIGAANFLFTPKTRNLAATLPEAPETRVAATKWLTLHPGETGNALSFGSDGSLADQSNILLEKVPVSYSSNGTETAAQSLIVSPASPSGNFNWVRACEGKTADSGLCWAVYLVDRARGKTFKPPTGKYGIESWAEWSPDERYAVLASTTEGSWWLHAIDLATGDRSASIELGQVRPQLDGFAWGADSKFTLTAGESSSKTIAVQLPALFDSQNDCSIGNPSAGATPCPGVSLESHP